MVTGVAKRRLQPHAAQADPLGRASPPRTAGPSGASCCSTPPSSCSAPRAGRARRCGPSARRARLNPRYFYESFDDLDALVVAVYDRVVAELGDGGARRHRRRPATTPAPRAAPPSSASSRFVDEDRRRARVLYVEALGNEALNRRRIETGHQLVSPSSSCRPPSAHGAAAAGRAHRPHRRRRSSSAAPASSWWRGSRPHRRDPRRSSSTTPPRCSSPSARPPPAVAESPQPREAALGGLARPGGVEGAAVGHRAGADEALEVDAHAGGGAEAAAGRPPARPARRWSRAGAGRGAPAGAAATAAGWCRWRRRSGGRTCGGSSRRGGPAPRR